jgi:hypothetical protein
VLILTPVSKIIIFQEEERKKRKRTPKTGSGSQKLHVITAIYNFVYLENCMYLLSQMVFHYISLY